MAFDAENIFSSWRETKKVQFSFILITVKFSECCHALFANQVYYSSSRSFQISCRSRNVRLVISGTSFLSYMFPCNPQLKTFRMQCKVKSHSNWCITCFPRLLNLYAIRKACRKNICKKWGVLSIAMVKVFSQASREWKSFTAFGEIERNG